jgi:hypothetical protein
MSGRFRPSSFAVFNIDDQLDLRRLLDRQIGPASFYLDEMRGPVTWMSADHLREHVVTYRDL